MKQNVGPIAIVIAVIVLVGVLYFAYQAANPSHLGPYDAKKYGPPAYVLKAQEAAAKAKQGGSAAPDASAAPGH